MKQKKIRRLFTFTSLMLALAVLLAACGGGNGGSSSSGGSGSSGGGKSDKKRTITVMVGSTGATFEGVKAVAAAAEEKLNIAVEFDIKPDGTEGDNVVKTRLATGDMADLLFYNSGALLAAINPEENFVDLTDKDFMEPVMDTFKQTVTVNGKVFGAPSGSSNAGGILYNKALYEELGLKIPKTWSEFMANNEVIKAAGKTAVIASYKDTWTSQLFVLADYYNVQKQSPNFAEDYTNNKEKYATNAAALRGFEKTQEVFEAGYMNKDFLATTYDGALKMLVEGAGVHYPMLTSALDAIYTNYGEEVNNIGYFAQPGDEGDSGATVWMPGGIYVNKEGSDVDAALEWLTFYVSKEGQAVLASVIKASGPFVIDGIQLPEDAYPGVKELQPYFDQGLTAPALEFLSPIKGPNLSNITVEVGSGISDAKKGAEDYDKDVIKQAQQLGLSGW